LDAGADRVAVATVEEGVALRRAGLGCRVLLLSEPGRGEWSTARAAGIEPTVFTAEGLDAAAACATASVPWTVHLKVDTGMHRIGCRPADALALAARAVGHGSLRLGSVWSHLAVADDP